MHLLGAINYHLRRYKHKYITIGKFGIRFIIKVILEILYDDNRINFVETIFLSCVANST